MTSKDELFSLYLSETDCPVFIEEKIGCQLNKENFINILENDAAVEEAFENFESMLHKRLVLNPFLDEDIRCSLFEKLINSDESEKLMSDLCEESYFTNNLVSNANNIVRNTGTILDWKLLKQEAVRIIAVKFTEKYKPKIDPDVLDKLNNKIFRAN